MVKEITSLNRMPTWCLLIKHPLIYKARLEKTGRQHRLYPLLRLVRKSQVKLGAYAARAMRVHKSVRLRRALGKLFNLSMPPSDRVSVSSSSTLVGTARPDLSRAQVDVDAPEFLSPHDVNLRQAACSASFQMNTTLRNVRRSTKFAECRNTILLSRFGEMNFENIFLKVCLGSLLAPCNVPALVSAGDDARLLVCTTPEDFGRRSEKDATFQRAAEFFKLEFFEMRMPAPEFLRPHLREQRHSPGLSIPAGEADWKVVTIRPSDVIGAAGFSEWRLSPRPFALRCLHTPSTTRASCS